MKTFTGFRPKVPEHYVEGGYGNLPDEAQFQGVEFDDGTVVVRWLTQFRSTSVWSNFAEFEAVHGHADYETRIDWSLAALPAPPGDTPGWRTCAELEAEGVEHEPCTRSACVYAGECQRRQDPRDPFNNPAAAPLGDLVGALRECRETLDLLATYDKPVTDDDGRPILGSYAIHPAMRAMAAGALARADAALASVQEKENQK